MGLVDHAPIVTPKLVKKFVSLQFGDDLDNLAGGIQPFLLAVCDYRSPAALALTNAAQTINEKYDLATAGEMSTTLADAKTMRMTTVTLLTDFIHAHAMLAAQ